MCQRGATRESGSRLNRMAQPALTAEESEILATIIDGGPLNLHNRRLIRLSHLRLIMLEGTSRFVPTALGYDWHRRQKEQMHGNG